MRKLSIIFIALSAITILSFRMVAKKDCSDAKSYADDAYSYAKKGYNSYSIGDAQSYAKKAIMLQAVQKMKQTTATVIVMMLKVQQGIHIVMLKKHITHLHWMMQSII